MTGEGVVLDASAAVDLIIGTPRAVQLRTLLRERALHAPHGFDAEVLSALARLVRAGSLGSGPAELGLEVLARMPVQRHLPVNLAVEAWRLRDNVRVTDGLYVALARALGMPLVTTDVKLAKAVRQRTLCDVRITE